MAEAFCIWLTGRSGAGKTTLAQELKRQLGMVQILDGDDMRERLTKGLGFSKEDRDTNIDRISYVSELLNRNGIPTIVAAISPYREARDKARAGHKNFIEVHVQCSPVQLEARDPKDLYKKGIVKVTDDYEKPLKPEVVVHTDLMNPDVCAQRVLNVLKRKGLIG